MTGLKKEESVLIEVPGGLAETVRIYHCARRWDDLAPTQMDSVRHCDACNQLVHEIEDADGFQLAISAKRCVRVMRRDGGYYLGQMQVDYQPPSTGLTWDE